MTVTKHSFDATGTERLRLLGIKVVRDEVTGLVHQDDRLVARRVLSVLFVA
jgi:hypothetical protein